MLSKALIQLRLLCSSRHWFSTAFYQTLEHLGLQQFQCHEFPDHHDYEIEDLQFDDNSPIITTEKMQLKLWHYSNSIQIISGYLGGAVDAVLSPACYTILQQQLEQQGISIS